MLLEIKQVKWLEYASRAVGERKLKQFLEVKMDGQNQKGRMIYQSYIEILRQDSSLLVQAVQFQSLQFLGGEDNSRITCGSRKSEWKEWKSLLQKDSQECYTYPLKVQPGKHTSVCNGSCW